MTKKIMLVVGETVDPMNHSQNPVITNKFHSPSKPPLDNEQLKIILRRVEEAKSIHGNRKKSTGTDKDDNLQDRSPTKKNSAKPIPKTNKKIHLKTSSRMSCKLCNKSFRSNLTLIKHKQETHPAGRHHKYGCKSCRRRFDTKPLLIKHAEIHNSADSKRSRSCTICDRTFRDSWRLNEHLQLHDPSRRKDCKYACEVCHLSYHRLRNLNEHNLQVHSKKAGVKLTTKYSCSVCKIHFEHEQGLTKHNLQEHTKRSMCQQYNKINKLYDCTFCGRACPSKFGLKAHLETHNPNRIKGFNCKVCGSSYYEERHLKRHVLVKHHPSASISIKS